MRRKIEFSKLVVGVVTTICISIIIFSAYLMYERYDLTALPTLIGATFGLLGTTVAFYMDKSKKENIQKIESNPEYLMNLTPQPDSSPGYVHPFNKEKL